MTTSGHGTKRMLSRGPALLLAPLLLLCRGNPQFRAATPTLWWFLIFFITLLIVFLPPLPVFTLKIFSPPQPSRRCGCGGRWGPRRCALPCAPADGTHTHTPLPPLGSQSCPHPSPPQQPPRSVHSHLPVCPPHACRGLRVPARGLPRGCGLCQPVCVGLGGGKGKSWGFPERWEPGKGPRGWGFPRGSRLPAPPCCSGRLCLRVRGQSCTGVKSLR